MLRPARGPFVGLCALAALAFAIRLAAVVALADPAHPPYTFEHGPIAASLLNGDGFSIRFLGVDGPTSQQAPGYPLLLAGVTAIFGAGFVGLLVMQVLQAAVGAGATVLLALLVGRLLPGVAGASWLAGVFVALQPTQIYAVTQIQPAVWIGLLLVALLYAAVRPGSEDGWRREAVCGALGGLLLLFEPIMALVMPIVALVRWFVAVRADVLLPRVLARQAVLAAMAALVISPWIARNALVHGELVFIKSTFGYAFWQGNNPASHGTDKIPTPAASQPLLHPDGTLAVRAVQLEQARLATRYIDDVVLTDQDRRELAALGEPARCRLLLSRACEFIGADPAAYARLCTQRLRYFLVFDETNPRTYNATFRIATVVWLVLSFTGVLATMRYARALWPTYAVFTTIALFHTLTITSVRFRLPIEPLGWIWAAVALAPLTVHFRRPPVETMKAGETTALPEGTRLSEPHSPLRGPHRLGQEQPATTRPARR